jgi:hypothetical protein
MINVGVDLVSNKNDNAGLAEHTPISVLPLMKLFWIFLEAALSLKAHPMLSSIKLCSNPQWRRRSLQTGLLVSDTLIFL